MARYFGFDPVRSGKYYFISYNAEDADRVGKIALEMNNRGIPIWYDEGIESGEDWEEEIARRIQGCHEAIMFVTKNLMGRRDSYVKVEYSLAKQHGKKVHIVNLDQLNINDINNAFQVWYVRLGNLQGIPVYDLANVNDIVDTIQKKIRFNETTFESSNNANNTVENHVAKNIVDKEEPPLLISLRDDVYEEETAAPVSVDKVNEPKTELSTTVTEKYVPSVSPASPPHSASSPSKTASTPLPQKSAMTVNSNEKSLLKDTEKTAIFSKQSKSQQKKNYIPMIALLCAVAIGVFVMLKAIGMNKTTSVDDTKNSTSSSSETSSNEPYAIELYGKEYMSNVSTLNLTDTAMTSTSELLTHINEFTNLQSVNVTGCNVNNDELWAAQQQLGDIDLIWSVSICGIEVPTDTRYLHIHEEQSVKEIQLSNSSSNYDYPFGLIGSGTGVTSYDGIENIQYVTGLEGLRITSSSFIFDASWLKNLTKLNSMTLEGKIVNTSVLGNMPQIEELSIGCSVSDHYTFLASLKNLRRLHIYNRQDDMSFSLLNSMENLQELNLQINDSTEYSELINILKNKTAFTTLSLLIDTGDKLDFSLLNQTPTTSLELSIFKIGSGSADTLFSLQNISSLSIFTYSSIVSKNTVDKLKNSLSGCYITYYSWG